MDTGEPYGPYHTSYPKRNKNSTSSHGQSTKRYSSAACRLQSSLTARKRTSIPRRRSTRVEAASMAGEEAGRRGIPSLLNPSSSSSEGEHEHIASDVTQVKTLPLIFSSFSVASVSTLFFRIHVQRFLQLIGWTPLIELKRITGKDGVDARIVGKVEAYQPLCSVKDRSALRSGLFLRFFDSSG